MSHSKGGQGRRGAPPITAKGRGWGADYGNVALQSAVSPRTVLTSKSWGQSACPSTSIHFRDLKSKTTWQAVGV